CNWRRFSRPVSFCWCPGFSSSSRGPASSTPPVPRVPCQDPSGALLVLFDVVFQVFAALVKLPVLLLQFRSGVGGAGKGLDLLKLFCECNFLLFSFLGDGANSVSFAASWARYWALRWYSGSIIACSLLLASIGLSFAGDYRILAIGLMPVLMGGSAIPCAPGRPLGLVQAPSASPFRAVPCRGWVGRCSGGGG